jgi:hypothetical protein
MQDAFIGRTFAVFVVTTIAIAQCADRRVQCGEQRAKKWTIRVAASEQALGRLVAMRKSGRRLEKKSMELLESMLVTATWRHGEESSQQQKTSAGQTRVTDTYPGEQTETHAARKRSPLEIIRRAWFSASEAHLFNSGEAVLSVL